MGDAVSFDFSDKRALVTGGTRGIGYAVATGLADAGAAVTVTGTRVSASDYDAALSRFAYLQLCGPSDVEAVASRVDALDVLVNNAGLNLPGGRDEWQPDVFDETVALNLSTTFRMCSALHPVLSSSKHEGGAAVVNMASMASYIAKPMVPGYGAAKAAIVQMTKNLAVAWAGEPVRVNAVAPGVIRTDMTEPMMGIAGLADPELSRTPMGRFGDPADVVPTVMFLASPATAYVTGQTWNVDGGYSIA